MIKYYKTPDVIVTDQDGRARCANGIIVLNTEFMSEESNATALRLVNCLGFIKCSKIEAESRAVATPCGVVEFEAIKVIENPTEVIEESLHKFVIIKNGEVVKTLNLNDEMGFVGQELYDY